MKRVIEVDMWVITVSPQCDCNNSLMSPLFQAGSNIESNINDQQGCVILGGKSIFVKRRSS